MKRKLLRLAACAGTAGLIGCTGQHVTAPSGIGHRTEAITFSVGPCFGFCPVYHASITPSGAVSFAGERHTAVIGDRQRKVGAGAYQAIAENIAEFRPADGTTSAVECTAAISDTSTWSVTWTDEGGRQTTATLQQGCPGGPAQRLGDILRDMPRRLGISDWSRQVTRPGESRG